MTARERLAALVGVLACTCAVVLLDGALGLEVIAASAQSAGGAPDPAAERGIPPAAGCCRWELAAVTGHGEHSAEAPRGPVTMLLDQCTGRTWLLRMGPRGEFEWSELSPLRPPWVFRPE